MKDRTSSIATEHAADEALVISRTFDAPRSLVFKAWTEPDRMKQWWGPKGYTCPVCRIDLRPGGVCLSCMRSSEGKDYWSRGIYLEVVEPERLVCTDMFADESGNLVSPQYYGMSADWPAEAIVAVTFDEADGKTRMTIEHYPIKPGKERDMCRQGWNESLDKLADYLATAKDTTGA